MANQIYSTKFVILASITLYLNEKHQTKRVSPFVLNHLELKPLTAMSH
jgi:hypothetical protein